MDEELFIEELTKANDKYFKKYFLDKDINTALYNAFVDCIKTAQTVKPFAPF